MGKTDLFDVLADGAAGLSTQNRRLASALIGPDAGHLLGPARRRAHVSKSSRLVGLAGRTGAGHRLVLVAAGVASVPGLSTSIAIAQALAVDDQVALCA